MPEVRAPYDKPALPVAEQLLHLEKLGLDIPDRDKAGHYLDFVGLFRLSGYCHPFLKHGTEEFRPGTTFDDVLGAYVFDRKLRLLTTDALERIEVAVRTRISNIRALGGGPFWIADAGNFDNGSYGQVRSTIEGALRDRHGRIKHDHISDYMNKYSGPDLPPCWMIIEALTFGDMSRLYKHLRNRRDIAEAFDLQHDVLESWLHTLTFVRNVCAHHGRLWNRQLTIAPKIPKRYRKEWTEGSRRRYYIVACLTQHLMQVIADGSHWAERLRALIEGESAATRRAMAFPDEWQATPLWSQAFSGAAAPVLCPHNGKPCHPADPV